MESWQGRIDGTEKEHLRWHQIVTNAQEVSNFANHFVIVGFESDEGVARNKGRQGARKAPNELRSVMANFPAQDLTSIYDWGNISCNNNDLEQAQTDLIKTLSDIYNKDGKTIVLGGGHEITYPHFKALKSIYPNEKIGVINFDAHFDNRVLEPEIGATSGTGFYQIAKESELHSLHIGIQTNSNTKALFDWAHENSMHYILAQDFYLQAAQNKELIQYFINKIDILYVTVCMDVFSAAFAPGVSATAYNGMIPDAYFQSVFQEIIQSTKLKAFDIAEVNPELDIDKRTAKLAASFVYEIMQNQLNF